MISLLILVHELGHFSVARLLKIRVDRFGFGLPFGPTLWEKKIGDVTYCIHAFLLGGYVAFPDDDPESDLPLDDPARLKNRKVWERALVISAGVTANVILAYVIVFCVILFTRGVPTDFNNIYVEKLVDEISVAAEAGLEKGDKVVSINGIEIKSFMEFKKILTANKTDDGYVSNSDLEKQLKQIVEANPHLIKNLGFNTSEIKTRELVEIENTVIPPGKVINVPALVYEDFLLPDLKDPFAQPQVLSEEDKLTDTEKQLKSAIVKEKFAGNGYTTFGEIAKAAADGKHNLNMVVERNGEAITLKLSPNKEGHIGIITRVEDVTVPLTSVSQLFTGSWDYICSKTYLMCLGLYKIFTGQISLWDLHGIVAITKIGGQIIQHRGMVDGWLLTALISIDLAIINLLPIPALDGGHLLFLLVEKLRGRPVEEKYQEAFMKYGFLFLIGLMIFIIFNDILAIVTGKF